MSIAVDFDGTLWSDNYLGIGNANLGLVFNAINDNVSEMIERWENDSRKITADIYIDNRSEKPWSMMIGKAV